MTTLEQIKKWYRELSLTARRNNPYLRMLFRHTRIVITINKRFEKTIHGKFADTLASTKQLYNVHHDKYKYRIGFNPSYVATAKDYDIKNTILHELAHALYDTEKELWDTESPDVATDHKWVINTIPRYAIKAFENSFKYDRMGNSKIDKELFLSYTHNDEWANLFEKLLRATKEPGEPSVYGKTTPEYDILQEKRLPKYIKKKREREEKMKSR